jgi:CCR4-NOT transcription complex subunit 7/8
MSLLKRSGFDFQVHRTRGIPHRIFAEHFMTSGLCMNPSINWITFHGSVDFGYLLKYLIGNSSLPQEESGFFELMKIYLFNFFDVKEIKRDIIHLSQSGGLAKLAKDLDVDRIGTVH